MSSDEEGEKKDESSEDERERTGKPHPLSIKRKISHQDPKHSPSTSLLTHSLRCDKGPLIQYLRSGGGLLGNERRRGKVGGHGRGDRSTGSPRESILSVRGSGDTGSTGSTVGVDISETRIDHSGDHVGHLSALHLDLDLWKHE